MASALTRRFLFLPAEIRFFLFRPILGRTYTSQGLRDYAPLKISRPFGFNAEIGRNYSSRASKRSMGNNFEDGFSNEVSNFETELEWAEPDFEVDSEWFHDVLEITPDIIEVQSGRKEFDEYKENAWKLAVSWLAKRACTTAELMAKLRNKKIPTTVIESMIDELKRREFLDDKSYAESFCRSRWTSLNWGPCRIKKALLQKGVKESDIERATDLVFREEGQKNDLAINLSTTSLDRLFAQASKQWVQGKNLPLANRRARMMRWLQYRGFDWGVTSYILKKLESHYPP
ncbi:regulatory protein RecX family protein [Wolffia australiana]